MDEALRQVGKELGPEAIILHTKRIPIDESRPFAQSNIVEVVAALDDDPPKVQRSTSNVRCSTGKDQGSDMQPETRNPKPEALGRIPDHPIDLGALQRELAQLKGMVSGLVGRGHLPPDLPDALNLMYWSLLTREVDEGIARRWVVAVRDRIRESVPSAPTLLSESLAEILAEEMITSHHSKADHGRRVVVLVGPTGVGKTTTIAKLAAACRFREGKRVVLITNDSYRIAGAQQLKSYADLMGLPYCLAPLPADLARVLADEQNADVIFIDTVGRSARRQDQVEELATYVRGYDGCEVHLVLSATTKRSDLLQAIEGYRLLGFSSIIATKVDETATVGPILEAALAAAAPISYVTTGQEVPDDIEKAHPLRLAWRLIGGPEGRREE